MNSYKIGVSNIESPRLAYGCMRIVGTWNPAEITPAREEMAHNALRAAYDAGYTLFDHADIYCRGACEEMHGRLLKTSPDLRRRTIIATKCGIRRTDEPNSGDPGRYDFSKNWIIESCERSLMRLGVETIDIYQLHRPDVLMDPREVADAFSQLHNSGKVKWFGVSNFLPSQLAMLMSMVEQPIIVNQIEVSLARHEPFTDGTLDQCIEKSVVPLSWSPLGGGKLAKSDEHNKLNSELKLMAKNRETTIAVIALSWLLKHPSKIVPIVGSANPQNIQHATRAVEIDLTREEWYKLYVAARGEAMP